MSYQPYNRNTSGIVFFGEQGSQQTYYSDSNFLIEDGAAGNIQVPNLKIADGGNIGSVSDPDAIAIAANGNVTVSQSLSVTQNLTVNGTLTTVATNNLTVEDPLIFLGSGNNADSVDLGFFSQYSDDAGSTIEYAGLFRDAGDEKYRLFHSLTEKPTTTVNTGGAGYTVASLVANLEGDVTGNADTATALASSQDFSIGGNNEASSNTVAFDGTGAVELQWAPASGIITNRAELTSVDAANDYILIYDDDANALKRINRSNFVSGLGGFSNFIVSDRVTTGTVDDGEQVIFTDGPTINFTVAAEGGNHTVSGVVVDASIDENKLATSVAGDGLSGGGGSALSANVDDTTIEINTDALRVKDAGITEAKRFRDVQAVTATSDTITGDIVTVDADTAGGNVTLTLPSHSEGKIVHIKKIDSSANTVSASTVDGGTLTLYSQYEAATIFSNGSAWYIV